MCGGGGEGCEGKEREGKTIEKDGRREREKDAQRGRGMNLLILEYL